MFQLSNNVNENLIYSIEWFRLQPTQLWQKVVLKKSKIKINTQS